jgi:chromosome segregation ATPase
LILDVQAEQGIKLEHQAHQQVAAELEAQKRKCLDWEQKVRDFLVPILGLGQGGGSDAHHHHHLDSHQLQDKLQQLGLVQKFFSSTVDQVQNQWQERFDKMSMEVENRHRQLDRVQHQLEGARRKFDSEVQGQLRTQQTMVQERHSVEKELMLCRANYEELKKRNADLESLKEHLDSERQARTETELRVQRLGENNKVLILELEERRDLIETIKNQVLLLEQERAKLRKEKDRAIGTLQTLLKMENGKDYPDVGSSQETSGS